MIGCEQTEGLNVYQHGRSVCEYSQKIVSGDTAGMRIPSWFEKNREKILANMHPSEVAVVYQVFHDCGKSRCLEVGEDGRRHFPNHAEVSSRVWKEHGGDDAVANLILWDMVLHTETADQIEARNFDIKDAMTLLVTAFAEIHANAEMFGGIESISFKQKWKKLDRRGKQLMRRYFS